MPGWSNADNKFGPTSYVVGTVLGDGCNFISIQSAINQAVADGHSTADPTSILVRPGVYSSFTMAPGIGVEGVCAGSVFSNTASVIGNVTIDSTTAGGNLYSIKNLNISDPNDAFIIQGVAAPIFVDIVNCSINGTRGLVIGNTSGTLSQFAIRECRIVGSNIAVDLQQHNTVFTVQSTFQGASAFVMSGDSRAAFFDCLLEATVDYGIQMTGSVNRVNLNYTTITSPQESLIGTNSGETVELSHCTFTSSAVSGNYIDAVDIFDFYDLALKGTALINNATATNFVDWQPHAGTAATSILPGGVRGTSCFDSATFNVTDGFVELVGGPAASTFPVDNGGPGVPSSGAMSLLGSTSVDFPDPSGIETHVGATTNQIYLEDRRWLSAFVVDPSATVGLRGTFTTIQAAINAATPSTAIYVRPGTYAETLTFLPDMAIIAIGSDGKNRSTSLGPVQIVGGPHVYSGNGQTELEGLTFSSGVGVDLFNIGNAGAATSTLVMKDCECASGNDCFVIFSAAGFGGIVLDDCRCEAQGYVINVLQNGEFDVSYSRLVSAASGGMFLGGICNGTLQYSDVRGAANPAIDFQAPTVTVTAHHNYLEGAANPISFNAAATYTASHNTYRNLAASSEYIIGPGNYTYANEVVNPIGSSGIDNAAVQTILGWRPWATAVAAPGTSSEKGTCSFDSTQFTVTDGFVQASFSGLFPWVEQNASTTVNPNEGNFTVAVITLTLPAQPQPMGVTCKFKVVTNDTLIIAGNPGDFLQLGSSGGTALTNTSSGDAIELTHYDLGIWIANSVVGNWTVTP